ncbi:MAG: V-type ATP synthase subunit F [Acetanaerobacterium sp.]
MYRIGVLGDRDSIYGFSALGLDTYVVDDPTEAVRTFRQLSEGDYAVIYVTEALAGTLENELARCAKNVLPAVILIPGVSGNTGVGLRRVRKFVEQAVGSDIIFGPGQ